MRWCAGLVCGMVWLVASATSAQENSAVSELTRAATAESAPAATDTSSSSAAMAVPVASHLANARAAVDYFLKSTNAQEFDAAIECLDFSALPGITKTEKHELAYRLKEALDRLILIDLEAIRNDPDDTQYVYQPVTGFSQIEMARGDDGAWRFTSDTVSQIDDVYAQVQDRPRVAGDWVQRLLPDWAMQTVFLLPNYQWLALLVVILLGMVADAIVRFLLNQATTHWLRVVHIQIDPRLGGRLWKPMGLLVRALVWYGGTVWIGLPPSVLYVLLVAVKFFAVFAAVWTAFCLIDVLGCYLLSKAVDTETKFDDLIIPLISRSLKVFVAAVGLVTMAQALDLPIAGLLGGLGLGGLAVAFAAKDTLANLFGSITVLVDRPFEIGDWIKTQDIEGTVETVGMRSTRIRTFYNSQITVPNSLLITAVVDNMGRRRYRRIKTMLSLQYDTSADRIEAFCEGVRELIRRHPYTRKDYYHVYLNAFSSSSVDVLLYCFVECGDWAVELRERHRLFVDILKLAEQLDVHFAFPTRTLHMHPEKPAPVATGYFEEPLDAGRQTAAVIAGSLLRPEERPGPVDFLGPSEIPLPPQDMTEQLSTDLVEETDRELKTPE